MISRKFNNLINNLVKMMVDDLNLKIKRMLSFRSISSLTIFSLTLSSLVIILFISFTLFCILPHSPAKAISFTKDEYVDNFTGVVVKVSDGDTIWVKPDTGKRIKIRIWGIDTPEKFRSRKLYNSARACGTTPGKVKHLGQRASGFARRTLKGKRVRVEVMGRGRYGRLLAKIIILPEEEDYGLKIIKEGFSCVYWKSTDRKYIEAMEKARKERKGLWNVDFDLMNCLCY